MSLRLGSLVPALTAFVALSFWSGIASAVTVGGTVEPTIPSGQFMSMMITINDTKTKFELTGPDFSWFAFGFDTTTMFGYALIIEGTGADRTVTEQNLLGLGNPGDPQTTQNVTILNTTHNVPDGLTTIVLERANNTGDMHDAIFSPSMTSLDIIGAYDSFSSPSTPNPYLSYHGSRGRGFGTIAFSPVPEPGSMTLATLAVATMLLAAAGHKLRIRHPRIAPVTPW